MRLRLVDDLDGVAVDGDGDVDMDMDMGSIYQYEE